MIIVLIIWKGQNIHCNINIPFPRNVWNQPSSIEISWILKYWILMDLIITMIKVWDFPDQCLSVYMWVSFPLTAAVCLHIFASIQENFGFCLPFTTQVNILSTYCALKYSYIQQCCGLFRPAGGDQTHLLCCNVDCDVSSVTWQTAWGWSLNGSHQSLLSLFQAEGDVLQLWQVRTRDWLILLHCNNIRMKSYFQYQL